MHLLSLTFDQAVKDLDFNVDDLKLNKVWNTWITSTYLTTSVGSSN